jgi:hypothetical protein
MRHVFFSGVRVECKTLEENRKTQMVKLGEALEEARGGGTRTETVL